MHISSLFDEYEYRQEEIGFKSSLEDKSDHLQRRQYIT